MIIGIVLVMTRIRLDDGNLEGSEDGPNIATESIFECGNGVGELVNSGCFCSAGLIISWFETTTIDENRNTIKMAGITTIVKITFLSIGILISFL
jgi:hypothetical protein